MSDVTSSNAQVCYVVTDGKYDPIDTFVFLTREDAVKYARQTGGNLEEFSLNPELKEDGMGTWECSVLFENGEVYCSADRIYKDARKSDAYRVRESFLRPDNPLHETKSLEVECCVVASDVQIAEQLAIEKSKSILISRGYDLKEWT